MVVQRSTLTITERAWEAERLKLNRDTGNRTPVNELRTRRPDR